MSRCSSRSSQLRTQTLISTRSLEHVKLWVRRGGFSVVAQGRSQIYIWSDRWFVSFEWWMTQESVICVIWIRHSFSPGDMDLSYSSLSPECLWTYMLCSQPQTNAERIWLFYTRSLQTQWMREIFLLNIWQRSISFRLQMNEISTMWPRRQKAYVVLCSAECA